MTKRVHTALLTEFADFLGLQMGWFFPKERWLDLLKGIQTVSREFGFEDPEACIKWLMSSPLKKGQIETLACQFTVGETYFFREPRMFEALEKQILPELIRTRWESDRRIRFWSAGCCTGEEPYSLAILVSRMIPDLKNWNISILATDINPNFLQRASDGVYREWSFRGTPYWLKDNYFRMNRDGNYEILPQIKKMVKFQYLNLVEDVYPSLFNDTNAMDFIFCRNVLMYFTQEHMAKSIDRFHQCLLEKGWLLVGSSETSHIFFPQYVACNFPGAILYHKDGQTGQKMSQYFTAEPFEFTLSSEPSVFIPGVTRHEPQPSAVFHRVKPQPVLAMEPKTTVSVETAAAPAEESQYEEALALYEDGSYEAVVSKLADRSDHDPKCMTLVAKAFANQGKLNDAIAWCEKAISIEKLNPEFHHLRAVILQERGQLEDAIASLKRALYIDSNFVLAHFMLGNLSQQAGRLKESRKCFENALVLLSGYEQDTVITESDGLTAGRLKELILLMLNQEMHA